MNPELRPVRKSDLPQIYDLLEAAFPEARRELFVVQTENDSTFRLRHGRVALIDGRVVGYVRIFARTMFVRGVPLPAGGIGQVATNPAAQHSGVATALMLDAIETMMCEGMALSFLFTGIPAFYERVGYRVVHETFLEAPSSALAASSIPGPYDVRALTRGDLPRLVAIHHRAIAGGTGAVRRSRREWLDAVTWLDEDPPGCLVAELQGTPVAYIRCRHRDYGYQIVEAECLPQHVDAILALVSHAAHRALDLGCDTIGGLIPAELPLAIALGPRASRTTEARHPMMMRALTADRALAAAIRRQPMRFWNVDRI